MMTTPSPRQRLLRLSRTSRLTALALMVGTVSLAACAETPKKPTAAPPTPPPPQAGRLDQRFDAARGMTLLRVRPPTPPPPGRSLALVAAGGFAGHTPRQYTSVLLGLRSADAHFHLAACKRVTIRVGERDLGTFPATRETEIGAGWLAEYVLAMVPFTRAYALIHAAGQDIEVRACEAHHRLDPDERDRLGRLVDALKPQTAP